MDGELTAQSLEFVPNEKGLKSQRLQIDANQVSDFQFARVTEDESTRMELRFKARTPVDGAEGVIGAFARRVGQSASQLTVSYYKQENLPGMDGQEQPPLRGEALAGHQKAMRQ